MEMEDSSENDFGPIEQYSHNSADVYDHSDDYRACSCNDFDRNSTRIPHLCPYWEYSWSDVPLTSSSVTLSPSFIQLPQHIKAIRLGVGTFSYDSGKETYIYCYLNHLEKQMGWCIKAVTRLYEPDKFVELKCYGVDDTGGEMLVASIACPSEDEKPVTLKFRFYLSGSTSSYDYDVRDIRFGAQLWEAAVNEHVTDVVFLVGDRSFPAHKFLLAARSPVFSVMFGTDMVESRTGRVKVDDADPDTFQQFLRFLYTGQLEEPASEELAIIADKYDVKTLITICKTASFSFDADAEDVFASVQSTQAARTGIPLLTPIRAILARFWESVSITGDLSWPAVCEERWHSSMTSVSISKNTRPLSETDPHYFEGSFVMPDQICLSGRPLDEDVFRVVEAFCRSKRYTMDDFNRSFTRMKPLNDPAGSDEDAEPAMQKFTATVHPEDILRMRILRAVPFEFHVCDSPSIPEFRYAFRDWRLAKQLWSSSVDKEWTDVDFQVGDRTFSAHLAILAARCPALIPPGSNDSSFPVRIENVEASVFEDLLYFLYTGELKTFTPSKALYKAAVTYQVDLLQRLFEMRPFQMLEINWSDGEME